MEKLVIYTDETSDLPEKYYKELNIKVLNLSFNIDERHYTNEGDDTLTIEEFYTALRAGKKVSTSQINPDKFEKAFEEELKKGNNVVFIAISSGLSGTYNNAVTAANNLNPKYEAKIYPIDSLGAALGEGLITLKTAEFAKKAKSVQEVVDYAANLVPKMFYAVTVDDLRHLQRGGRVTKSAAFIGTLLQLKPMIYVNTEGKLIPFAKSLGRKKALNNLIDIMEKYYIKEENDIIAIGHSDCLEDAKTVGRMIEERLGIKNIIYNYLGKIIGAHTGPGTVALFFIAKDKILKKD